MRASSAVARSVSANTATSTKASVASVLFAVKDAPLTMLEAFSTPADTLVPSTRCVTASAPFTP